MRLISNSFANGAAMPAEFAFGQPGSDSPCVFAGNRNPHLAWSQVPEGTRSFALVCIDIDVPTDPETVNRDDCIIPVDQPRGQFVHWLLANLPADRREIAAGAYSDGVVPRGKPDPAPDAGGLQGLNDYTHWFAGDTDMAGDYLGYDGPCPPWNDERLHHYHFRLHALAVAALDLPVNYVLANLNAAIDGHVLAEAEWIGTCTLNPALR
jgi:hypothetical protein